MFSLLGSQVSRKLTASSSKGPTLSDFYHVNGEFDTGLFQKELRTRVLGRQLIYRATVTSTMNVAWSEAEAGANTGAIILAEEQTEGRGRANRPWQSPAHVNLYFTLILRPKEVIELPKLNFATAIAIARTARGFGVSDAGVKWPNDIWVNRKKLAGILTDSSIMGSSVLAMVGVGINVNQDMMACPDEEVRSVATSLTNLVDAPVRREVVLASFCNELEELLSEPFEAVLQHYREVDLLAGQKVWVMPKKRENPERQAATVLDLDTEGSLVVKLEENGEIVHLVGEEVSIRLQ